MRSTAWPIASVYQSAREAGLEIPTDLSVIGFDDQPSVADSLFPGLTTLGLPHFQMGAWGVQTLIDLVEHPSGAVATAPVLAAGVGGRLGGE